MELASGRPRLPLAPCSRALPVAARFGRPLPSRASMPTACTPAGSRRR